MNQTNLLNVRFCQWIGKHALSANWAATSMALLFLMVATTGISQTKQQLGEEKTAVVYDAIRGEIKALEVEEKQQSAGVKTNLNYAVVSYYNSVLRNFNDNVQLSDVLLNVEEFVNVTSKSSDSSRDYVTRINENKELLKSGDLSTLKSIVNNLDFSQDGVQAALEPVFDFWRTLKNR